MDNKELLRKKAFEGLEELGFSDNQEYIDRLEYELKVIEELGFTPYFLVMWDIAKYAKDNNILYGPGRGSGCGSLLNYCLKITLIDPIKYGLYFERFLNPSRVSPPDIDWDTGDRNKIINYIENKYGKDQVSRVGSLNFLRTKSAIRDIGRALGEEFQFIENLTKLVPPPIAGLWDSFEQECKAEPKLLDQKYAHIIKPVEKLWGVTRSYGTHAGGIAIAPGPINRFVPLYKDKDGNAVSQFDWRDLEAAGLLKFDILGLKTLEIINLCTKYVKESGHTVELEKLEDGDKKAYKIIQQGDLDGIFQLGGSESIKQLTINIFPTSIEDLSFINALFRPGPLTKNKKTGKSMVDIAVARKTGKEPIEYLHPLLEPILKNTMGTIVYQEQSMRIAKDLAGFSGAKSDTLRKAIGKKIEELMKSLKEEFIEGCLKSSIEKEISTQIWDAIEGSAKYSFNASHSLAYSVITYWTAYLKAHYPVEFYAALLAYESDPNMVTQYASSAKDHGIEILPPDINMSRVLHQPEGNAIRFGLGHIKGMPRATAEEIVRLRDL
jgi:DNA polymerase-3 subunit alpha